MMIIPVLLLEVGEDMNTQWPDQKEGTWLTGCLW
jgi:hypothetical protein